MYSGAHFGVSERYTVWPKLYDDSVAEVSKQALAAYHYGILHKRGKVKTLLSRHLFLVLFFFPLFLTLPQTKHCGFFFSSGCPSRSSSPLPLFFFPLLLLICPCSLSLFFPPFLFFHPLSQPPLFRFLPPLPPSPMPRSHSLSLSQHVIKSNLSGGVKAKQQSWMGKIETEKDGD